MNIQEIKGKLKTKIDMNEVISFKELQMFIDGYEQLAYEKDVLNQTVIDLKAKLSFEKKQGLAWLEMIDKGKL